MQRDLHACWTSPVPSVEFMHLVFTCLRVRVAAGDSGLCCCACVMSFSAQSLVYSFCWFLFLQHDGWYINIRCTCFLWLSFLIRLQLLINTILIGSVSCKRYLQHPLFWCCQYRWDMQRCQSEMSVRDVPGLWTHHFPPHSHHLPS